MNLNKIPKEELELLSYTEIAKMYLEQNKTTKTTADLFREVCNLLDLSEEEYMENIADFFQSLTTSKEFILLEDGTWDLKANHKIKIVIEDEDENNQEELEEENIESDVEPDDLDALNDNDSYLDDDTDDLADLTIINDEELEE